MRIVNLRDHPRIRGEHADGVLTRMSIGGSSPHTRGAQDRSDRAHLAERIIPAYAGSTVDWTTVTSRVADHPRIRGEHISRVSLGHCRSRIIPAYAGSTETPDSSISGMSDHPRIRGEHVIVSFADCFQRGSSPHTRGAHVGERVEDRARRIIPAYAGSTRGLGPVPGILPDHPRIRGEHSFMSLVSAPALGSSPHTRGALSGSRCGW